MILIFVLGGDVVRVFIKGNSLLFTDSSTNFQTVTPIEGLKLSKIGILKEFPELKGTPDTELREKAISKFKEKLKNFKTEVEIMDYVIDELTKIGYKLIMTQREGFRPNKVK